MTASGEVSRHVIAPPLLMYSLRDAANWSDHAIRPDYWSLRRRSCQATSLLQRRPGRVDSYGVPHDACTEPAVVLALQRSISRYEPLRRKDPREERQDEFQEFVHIGVTPRQRVGYGRNTSIRYKRYV